MKLLVHGKPLPKSQRARFKRLCWCLEHLAYVYHGVDAKAIDLGARALDANGFTFKFHLDRIIVQLGGRSLRYRPLSQSHLPEGESE